MYPVGTLLKMPAHKVFRKAPDLAIQCGSSTLEWVLAITNSLMFLLSTPSQRLDVIL